MQAVSDYRSEGPWHDWVMIRWSEDDPLSLQPDLGNDAFLTFDDIEQNGQFCYAPSRIVGKFFKVPINDGSYEYLAIVWPCEYKYSQSSVFTTKWKLNFNDWRQVDPAFEVVNCDTFVRHCLMIPEYLYNENGSKYFHEVWPRELWGDQFFNDWEED